MNHGLQPWLAHALWRARRAGRDMVPRRGASDRKTIREDVALRFLKGDGIEIARSRCAQVYLATGRCFNRIASRVCAMSHCPHARSMALATSIISCSRRSRFWSSRES